MDRTLEQAGRETLQHLEQLAKLEKASGGSCMGCRFGSSHTFSECRHPFARRGSFNAAKGSTAWSSQSQSQMRDGLCGADAKLRERAALFRVGWRWALRELWPLFVVFAVFLVAVMIAPFWFLRP